MRPRPEDLDLTLAVIQGHDAALLALLEAIRRYGAKDVEFGYDWPDDTEPPPDVDVRWYARVTFTHRMGRRLVDDVVEGESWAGPSHGRGHHVAQIDALAEVVRARGGTVVLEVSA
jgi:hypothetical protein